MGILLGFLLFLTIQCFLSPETETTNAFRKMIQQPGDHSKTTSPVCSACHTFFRGIQRIPNRAVPKLLSAIATEVCVAKKIEDRDVCRGAVGEMIDYIVSNLWMHKTDPHFVCHKLQVTHCWCRCVRRNIRLWLLMTMLRKCWLENQTKLRRNQPAGRLWTSYTGLISILTCSTKRECPQSVVNQCAAGLMSKLKMTVNLLGFGEAMLSAISLSEQSTSLSIELSLWMWIWLYGLVTIRHMTSGNSRNPTTSTSPPFCLSSLRSTSRCQWCHLLATMKVIQSTYTNGEKETPSNSTKELLKHGETGLVRRQQRHYVRRDTSVHT